MKSSAITIKQISSLSGYSISTVSKALNNKLEISKATQDAIKTIAKQHNYVPNNYAVSLRNRKTQSIAVILPKVTQECYSHALYHLQKSAERFGYRTLFFQSFNSNTKELNYIRKFRDGSIDGIVVISKEQKYASDYAHNSIPIKPIQITPIQSFEEIKEVSINGLVNLLKLASI